MMKEEITKFLNSKLLDNYLIGQTSAEENAKVENYISKYPEVKEAYNTLQNNLELVSQANAVEAPVSILGNILNELDDAAVVKLKQKPKKSWFNYGIAASVVAVLFASYSFFLYNQNLKLSEENQVVVDEIFDLRSDINENNERLNALMDQFNQLNNPETEKYVLKGNRRAKNLKTVAYINPKDKTTMIDVVSLPQLPEEQYYKLWAEVQDKMVGVGILSKADRRLQKIPYTKDALGLSITVEQKGQQISTQNDNTPVAEIELKLND